MRNYQIGEEMSDEDSLAHYGVKGMKWGKHRAQGSGYDIREARASLAMKNAKIQSQQRKVNKTHKSKRAGEKLKLDTMKADFLNNPDRVLAARLTRGEKAVAFLLLTPAGAAGAIAATSARSRHIEARQNTGGYKK